MFANQQSLKHMQSKFLRASARTLRNFYDLRVPEAGAAAGGVSADDEDDLPDESTAKKWSSESNKKELNLHL
jgi:hypothetical protein